MSLSSRRAVPYQIRGRDTGDDQFDLSIRVSGFRFTVSVSAYNFVNSPKALRQFSNVLRQLEAGDDKQEDRSEYHDEDGNEDDDWIWDYCEQIADDYSAQFEQIAPPLTLTGTITLAELSPRGLLECEYRVQDEVPIVEQFQSRAMRFSPCPEWDMRTLSSYPLFDSSQVEICLNEPCSFDDIIPREVFAQSQRLFYKACWSPGGVVPEIEQHCKLDQVTGLHVSKLFGIVVNLDGQSKGLLYYWIDTENEGTLTAAVQRNPSSELRNKWVTRVRDTVKKLHSLGVIWGDAKPDNVLIDRNGSAIIIDSEGGTTRGWVDQDVAESVEGDLQGLERL